MLQWRRFFWTPLPYPGQQQNRGDRVKISADCSSAHVGHLAGSGAVVVDQSLVVAIALLALSALSLKLLLGASLAVLLA